VPSRADLLLDAAIDVLGTQGMRQLTHRAVDAAAGLPLGSTSNRFRTRESLLIGVLRRILERETAIWNRLAVDIRVPSVDAVAAAIGRLLVELTGTGRVLSQARRTVFVEATNQPALRAEITRLQDEIGTWMAPLLSDLGSSDPSRDVHHLLALMDGLVIDQLTSPRTDFDPTSAVAALLTGCTQLQKLPPGRTTSNAKRTASVK
jgi:DNA-binding transcriptional regulator YbjK